jgi:single-strand DNA-binding protein
MADGKIRMPNVNTLTISGRLTRDPELKHVGDSPLLRLGIATSKPYQQNGEWKEKTGFYNVDMWGDGATRVEKHLRKGAPVLIEGELGYRSWEKDGQQYSAVSIIARRVIPLDWPEEGAQGNQRPAPAQQQQPPRHPEPEPIPEEDIPF